MNKTLNNAIRFFAMLAVQILVLNKIQFSGYINPYIYILFIIFLPFETPMWGLLLTSFFMGLIMDMFSGIMGIHTAATVFIAFLRPAIFKLMMGKEELPSDKEPVINDFGTLWFLYYAGIMTFLHHFFLFLLEVFSFNGFFDTLLRTIINSVVSLLFIMIVVLLFSKKKDDRSL